MDKRERRFLIRPVELREDAAGAPHLVGYAAVFGAVADLGWFTETIDRGAFTKTVGEDDIRGLIDHDPCRIIGRNTAKTMTLELDDIGLKFDIELPGTTPGRDIAESVKRGDVSGCSFAFETRADSWVYTADSAARTLLDVKLYDVGPVTFPAYADTSVAVRSLESFRKTTSAPEPDRAAMGVLVRRQRQAEALGR